MRFAFWMERLGDFYPRQKRITQGSADERASYYMPTKAFRALLGSKVAEEVL
jgi:hypothetical protein